MVLVFLKKSLHSCSMEVFFKDEGASPKGKCPVDIQASEPQSEWVSSKGKRSRPNVGVIVLSLLIQSIGALEGDSFRESFSFCR